jgi:hypothetical protein
MSKLVIHSEQAVSEWSKSEWILLSLGSALLLIAAFLSRENTAALVVWIAIFLTTVFATTLMTFRVVINWRAHHIITFSIWGKILETIDFQELQSISITQAHHDGDISYHLAFIQKTGSSIGLNSYKSKNPAQHDAELLTALLRLRKVNLEIKFNKSS